MRNTAAGRRNKKSEKGDHHCSRQNIRIASNVFKRRRINRFPKADSNDPIVRSGPFSPLRNILPKGVSPSDADKRSATPRVAVRPLSSVLPAAPLPADIWVISYLSTPVKSGPTNMIRVGPLGSRERHPSPEAFSAQEPPSIWSRSLAAIFRAYDLDLGCACLTFDTGLWPATAHFRNVPCLILSPI